MTDHHLQFKGALPKDVLMAAMLDSQTAMPKSHVPTIFTAGFRFYFLSAGLFSIFAMAAWTLWLGVHAAGGVFLSVPMSMAPHMWHAHEMIFGYTLAVMAGFLLTAVPNWTGTREAGAPFVILSGFIWLAGRIAVWFSGLIDPVLVAIADLAFIPVLASNIIGRLAQKSQARNFVFLALLTVLFAANLLMHLEWVGWTDDTAESGTRLGIFVFGAMITLVGGRVVPAFTRNALVRSGYSGTMPRSNIWFDRAGIAFSLLVIPASLSVVPTEILGALCLGAGAANCCRLWGWKNRATLKEPIVWILHAAFLLLALGYLLYGCSLMVESFSQTASLHLLAVGAIGSMTLAMMTRASLGHSGRSLKVSAPIILAYLLMIAAALTRAFGTLAFDYFQVMLVSGGLWIVAFGLFAWVYYPILAEPAHENRS